MEDTPKRKGTKVFGSLERGLDKVITVLTRSKRKGSVKDGPRRLKVSGLEFFSSLSSPPNKFGGEGKEK
jgi:hypothetical protein